MGRSVTALAALLVAVTLGGCAWFENKVDPKKDWTAAQFYQAAKEEFDAKNWEASIKLYEQLESKYPYGRFADQAQLESAYANYKLNETAAALSSIDKFVKLHPNHPNLDYALYLKGLVNFKEDLGIIARYIDQDLADRDPKAARESFEAFKDLVTRFPDSRYTPDARERMAYLVEALARHEVRVAQYYASRGAYIAAINRAQDAITRFPNSPMHREALEVMIESYDRLGMNELREDTRKVLAKNYPRDKMAAEGQNRTKPWWRFWN